MLGRVILWMSLPDHNWEGRKRRVSVWRVATPTYWFVHVVSRSLVDAGGIPVQSAVPVDREEFHSPHFAFVLSLFVVRGEERQRGAPEVVHYGGESGEKERAISCEYTLTGVHIWQAHVSQTHHTV